MIVSEWATTVQRHVRMCTGRGTDKESQTAFECETTHSSFRTSGCVQKIADWTDPFSDLAKLTCIEVRWPVMFFFKINSFFFGYFDPINICFDNKNKYFSGWPKRYFGGNGIAGDDSWSRYPPFMREMHCNAACFFRGVSKTRPQHSSPAAPWPREGPHPPTNASFFKIK